MRVDSLGNWRWLVCCWLYLLNLVAYAQTNTIEVGQANLAAYTTTNAQVTPFQTINFYTGFSIGTIPNVFVLTPEFGVGGAGGTGDDPCDIRIRNISNTGFEAVCLEPHTENRNSAAVSFDYIAIAPGQIDIPTTTAGTSVTFFSACSTVTNQQYGPNCASCTGTQGFQAVNFPSGLFSSSPALLTQMTTTNNTLAAAAGNAPAGETEFVGPAVTAITSSGFNISVERFEAGIGGLGSSEEICYLAVEDTGCNTLDLSATGGSGATVNFEAVVNNSTSGGNQGHDDTARSRANFAGSCFSSPPIVTASMRQRRGNNGGFLRLDSLTSTRASFLVDEDRVSDPERVHIPEPISALAFSSAFTTPVTLSKVEISQRGRRVRFDWQTSAESFHIGFHLWGETSDGWVQLNKRLIPGNRLNTDQFNRYRSKIRLNTEQYKQITSFGISTLDTSGFEEFYGPFLAGEEYGDEDTTEPIDWTATRQQYDDSMQSKGYNLVNGRWKKLSKWRKHRREFREHRRTARALEVTFAETGMHQISATSILSLNPRWRGVDTSTVAITLNGRPVTRSILSDNDVLDDGDQIVLNVAAPQGTDALYLTNYVYRIAIDRRNARNAIHVNDAIESEDVLIDHGYSEYQLSTDKLYQAAMTTGSPWYDTELFSFSSSVDKTYSLSVSSEVQTQHPSKLRFTLFGSLDLPGNQQDHHAQIWVNDQLLTDVWFDGLTALEDEIEIPAGVLRVGENQIVVRLPGDTGLIADIVLIDELSVLLPDQLDITKPTFIPARHEGGFLIQTQDSGQGLSPKVVYAHTSNGDFNKVSAHQVDGSIRFAALPFVSTDSNPIELQYSVVSASELPTPATIERAELPSFNEMRLLSRADLMIVAHPNFISPKLMDYIKFKQDLGLTVKLVNWLDLVAKYGHGNAIPETLDSYLLSIEHSLRPKHVLLVGGHTYDYTNVLGQGVVNFIPAHYRKVGMFQYTPSDNVYADIDADNLPDLAIGRWPVRTQAELDRIIDKSMAWQLLADGNALPERVLLIAQGKDGQNLDFEGSLESQVVSNLDHSDGLLAVDRVYLDQVDGDSPVQDARARLADVIHDGARIVSFAGHASNQGWGFQGIVNTSVINDLNNVGKPTVVMPLACYTTDYQSMSTNTLAHQWLFAGRHGAVAVHGATSLGEYRNNGLFAERFMKAAKGSKTLGGAIMQAKRQMAAVNETLDNWALLGDPSIPAP